MKSCGISLGESDGSHGIRIEELPSFPCNENPFCHDFVNMGQVLGKDLTVMFSNHQSEHCSFLILINTKTGIRVKIDLLTFATQQPPLREV